MSCGKFPHSLYRQNQTPSRSKKHGNNVKSLRPSRLDHGNGLLYGVSEHLLSQLQGGQNSIARLMTKTKKKREHITPALIELHWLPVRQRIEYKLLLLTFNSLHGLARRTSPNYSADTSQHIRYALLTLTCTTPLEQSAPSDTCN